MKTRKILAGVLGTLLLLTVLPVATVSTAATVQTVELAPTFGQTEARKMIDRINDFRLGDQAWAWNENDTEKVWYTGLAALTYDYELEKVAMQRAAEIALQYSHSRPDGTRCFTAYPSEYARGYKGENIAAGYYTEQEVFVGWREDNVKYSGQGHRRNMLNANYKAVGIGHVYYNGTHYWVQEFSSVLGSEIPTPAADQTIGTSINVSVESLKSLALTQTAPITVGIGTSANIPFGFNIECTDSWQLWPSEWQVDIHPTWSSSDPAIARVEGRSVVGVSAGTATLSTDILGQHFDITVTVPARFSAPSIGAGNLISTADHSAYLSTRTSGDGTFDLRVLLVSQTNQIQAGDKVIISFDTAETPIVRTIAEDYVEGSTMKLFRSVAAAGEVYSAADGCLVYGAVIEGIPLDGFGTLSITVERAGEVIVTGTNSYSILNLG